MATTEFVTFLRELADWYEEHPLVPEPNYLEDPISVYMFGVDDPKEVLRSLGSFNKDFENEYFNAIKVIAGRTFKFWLNREKVCVAKVVGKRHVEASVTPETYIPSKVVEAHDEDVIEWDCEPVLAPESDVIKECVDTVDRAMEPSPIMSDNDIPF